jgi:signal transduction histidine kinase
MYNIFCSEKSHASIAWEYVSNFGIKPGIPPYTAQRIIVFNRINLFAIFISLAWLFYTFVHPTLGHRSIVALISLLIFSLHAFSVWLMFKSKPKATLVLVFWVYPPLIVLLSLASKQLFVLFNLFTLCPLLFYFVHRLKNIVIIYTYLFLCVLLGTLYQTSHSSLKDFTFLFALTAAFFLIFTSLYAIKKRVWSYEKELKAYNDELLEKNAMIQLQKELVEAQANELVEKTRALEELNNIKTKLFSIVSHDLKQHVYWLNRLLETASTSEDGYRYFQELLPDIKKDSDDTCALLSSLLEWSKTLLKSARAQPGMVDVNHVISAVTNFYHTAATQKNISYEISGDKNAFAFVDRNMIEMVFRNMVSNAIKFSYPGDKIVIITSRNGAAVSVKFIDSGIGMDKAEMDLLLDGDLEGGMGTLQEPGSGIGMILSKELLEKNNAQLFINSTKGKGTSIEVKLPTFK